MAGTGTERNLTEAEFKEQLLNEATSVTPNYSIDYEDERFKNIEAEETAAKNEVSNAYDGMINNSDQYFNAQIEASKDWADKQSQIQQENTDFTIEQIEQQKDKAHSDYVKEQSGAYVDWQKQSNQYGANAEKMASAGLNNSGFSESSQVSMYNTYQNRIATARESYNQAVLNYDNAIKDAQLQNNAALAEIAYQALEKQLELSLQNFQYKNQLLLDKTNKLLEVDNMYYDRWKGVLDQINTENALAEEIRQFDTGLEFQASENQKDRDHDEKMAEIEHNYNLERDRINNEFTAKENELNRKHDIAMQEAKTKAEKELLAQQHKNDLEKLKKQQEYELAQLDKKLANDKALIKYQQSFKSGGSGGSSSGSKIKSNNNNSGNNTVKITATNSGSNGKFSTSNVLDLGYGPINGTQLSKLVNSGEVNVTKDKNNNVTFSKTAKSVSLPTWDLMKKANKVK